VSAGHAPEFEVEVVVGGRVLGRGTGPSKRAAELAAAREALGKLDADP
jgi:dsRNA-specific ribonuclease